MTTVAASLVALATPSHAASALATTPDALWVTNGRVNAIEQVGNTIYLGGSFTFVGPRTGSLVAVDPATGARTTAGPSIVANGAIRTIIGDGSGGWYVGGKFSYINGGARQNVARIAASGAVLPFEASTNGQVDTLLLVGSSLYLGGEFTIVRGVARGRTAGVDPASGAVTSWRADTDGVVNTLAASSDGGQIFLGGQFTTVNGMSKPRLAAVRSSSGAVDGMFVATVNGPVNALVVAGPRLYVGGSFSLAGGVFPRQNVAAFDAGSGLLSGWTADTNGAVNALALSIDRSQLYLGGAFTTVAGTKRNRAAAVDDAGQLLLWDPNVSGEVYTLAPSPDGKTVYLGGKFLKLRSDTSRYVGVVDARTGKPAVAFEVLPNRFVRAVAPAATFALVGGEFTSTGAVFRPYLAALDATTGALVSSWAPEPNGEVTDLTLSPDAGTLYAVGRFSTVGSASRGRGAAFSTATRAMTAWDPKADASINVVAARSDAVYIGGGFSKVAGLLQIRLAKVSPTTGAADVTFVPSPDGNVRTISLGPTGTVYVGGFFTTIGGASRDHLAALTPAGLVTGWSPAPNNEVLTSTVSSDGSSIFVGTAGNATSRGNATIRFDTVTGAERWRVLSSGDAQAVALDPTGTRLYVGGHQEFMQPSGIERRELYVVDAATGALDPYHVDLDDFAAGVWAVTVRADGILVGGDFRFSGPTPVEGFARYAGTP